MHQKSQLPEDCDGQMDNLHLEDDPFSQKVTCSQQDGVNCGPVSITVEDDLQPRASNYPIQGLYSRIVCRGRLMGDLSLD